MNPDQSGRLPGAILGSPSLSRRDLLQRSLALGLGTSALAGVTGFGAGSAAAQDAAVPVIVLDGEPNNLHPLTSASRVTFTVLDEVNGFLARYDKDLNVLPALATSWDFVDEKTVRFHLRSGVKFHNGED